MYKRQLEQLVEQPDILHVEAEAMLSGIMLDTKDFTVRTGERTFEAAAFLRRAGADTSEVKKLDVYKRQDTVRKCERARHNTTSNCREV